MDAALFALELAICLLAGAAYLQLWFGDECCCAVCAAARYNVGRSCVHFLASVSDGCFCAVCAAARYVCWQQLLVFASGFDLIGYDCAACAAVCHTFVGRLPLVIIKFQDGYGCAVCAAARYVCRRAPVRAFRVTGRLSAHFASQCLETLRLSARFASQCFKYIFIFIYIYIYIHVVIISKAYIHIFMGLCTYVYVHQKDIYIYINRFKLSYSIHHKKIAMISIYIYVNVLLYLSKEV